MRKLLTCFGALTLTACADLRAMTGNERIEGIQLTKDYYEWHCDDNGNIVETRRFDKFLPLTESRVNTLDNSSITEAEIIAELRALDYRFTNWGDSSVWGIFLKRGRAKF